MNTIARSRLRTFSKEKSCAAYYFLPCIRKQMSFPLIRGTVTPPNSVYNFVMLPGLSGALLPAVQPKQRPVHKVEKKEKGQPLSTLLGLLFEEPELAVPASSQSHRLQTDPALPN